jgi:hypothetical protein
MSSRWVCSDWRLVQRLVHQRAQFAAWQRRLDACRQVARGQLRWPSASCARSAAGSASSATSHTARNSSRRPGRSSAASCREAAVGHAVIDGPRAHRPAPAARPPAQRPVSARAQVNVALPSGIASTVVAASRDAGKLPSGVSAIDAGLRPVRHRRHHQHQALASTSSSRAPAPHRPVRLASAQVAARPAARSAVRHPAARTG